MSKDFDWAKYENEEPQFDWGKYESQNSVGEVVDERSPDVSLLNRLIAKNFAQSPEKQLEFLKLKYPGLQMKLSGSSVLVKSQDGKFRPVDPSSFELADIGDMADVVGAGLASTAGTTLGGVAGALAGGAGAVPGALAGSAAAGSAYEALRQRIGAALGIPQEVSTGDVVGAGLANAAGGALLGTGLKAGQAGDYKGLIRGAWNKGMPAVARYWTGVTDDVVRAYTDPAEREVIDSLAQGGRTQYTDELVQRIRGSLVGEKKRVGRALEEAIDASQAKIDIAPIRRTYTKYIGDLQEQYLQAPNAVNKAKLDAAKADFDALFKNQRLNEKVFKEVTEGGELTGFKKIQEELPLVDEPKFTRDMSYDGPSPLQVRKVENPTMWLQGFEESRAPVTTQVKEMTRREAFPNTPIFIPDEVDAKTAFRLQQDLKEFGDLKRIGSGIDPRYRNNATKTEIDLADQALSGYQMINKQLEKATEGVSPSLKKEYGQLKDLEDALSKSLRGDQTAYNAFTGLDNRGKVMFKEALENLEEKTGDKFKDDIVKLQAADYFGSNSWTPKSIGGTTSTSRTVPAAIIGGVIGGKVGGAMGAPMLGAAAGLALGNASASPQALKYLIRSTDGLRSSANKLGVLMDQQYVTPIVRETLVQSPWFGVGE